MFLSELDDLIYYCHMYWYTVKSIVSCKRYTDQAYHSWSRKGESAECSVIVIARVQRKNNLMRGRSIQKSDGSREEAVFESVGT